MTRSERYQKKYGITIKQYNLMLKQQGGVCKLCKRPPKSVRLAVDHDHKSGRVRGLLCFQDNKFTIGRRREEHAPLLRRAADYLESKFDGRKL